MDMISRPSGSEPIAARLPDPHRRAWLTLALAGGIPALGGCRSASSIESDGPLAPRAEPLRQRPGVAWVFSSGGPRALVHVGVIQALDELGLRPDLIVGASAGALVGVLRASGMTGLRLREVALDLKPWMLLRPSLSGGPWLSVAGMAPWLRDYLPKPLLDEQPTPAACVAYCPARLDVVAFTAGDAGTAVAAACSIEEEFAPVRILDEVYVDADLHQPMPVRVARALGAQRVLAVDASAYENRAPPGTEEWREGDLRKRALTEVDARLADLVLHPDTGYYAGFSRAYRQNVIDIGRRDTLAAAQRLRALHGT